jgi:hypothetical protein
MWCVCVRARARAHQVKIQRTGLMCKCREIIVSDNCRLSLLVGPLNLQNFDVQLTTCTLSGTDACETNDKNVPAPAVNMVK